MTIPIAIAIIIIMIYFALEIGYIIYLIQDIIEMRKKENEEKEREYENNTK